jgi:predicted nucleic acid-binding Zn ribbon protein
MICKNCGKEMPDNEQYCSFCGRSLTSSDSNSNGSEVTILIILIMALVIVGVVIYGISYNKAQERKAMNTLMNGKPITESIQDAYSGFDDVSDGVSTEIEQKMEELK